MSLGPYRKIVIFSPWLFASSMKYAFYFWLIFATLSLSALAQEKPVYGMRVGEIFQDRDVRALANAAARGQVTKIEELITEKGINVDSEGYIGITPLWWALQRKNLPGFEKLLQLGADP